MRKIWGAFCESMGGIVNMVTPSKATHCRDALFKDVFAFEIMFPFYVSGAILNKLAAGKITAADVISQGTQIKLQLTLEGEQRVIFKPKRSVQKYSIWEYHLTAIS